MALWTATQLSHVMGGRAFVQCFDDDGDGTADTEIVAYMQEQSDLKAKAYIQKLYPEWVTDGDAPALAHQLSVQIAADMAYRRRPEFLVEGKTPAEPHLKDARDTIADILKGKARADDGSAVPTNVTASFRTGTVSNDSVTDRPRFIADDSGDFLPWTSTSTCPTSSALVRRSTRRWSRRPTTQSKPPRRRA